MSIRLSSHKVHRILRDYFRGLSQTDISQKIAADQASVSHYSSQFKERAGEIGILEAAKEFDVFNEVKELRSLATELYKSGMTPAEAKNGADIIKVFIRLGASPEQHKTMIKVCKEVADPGFVKAAIKLANIEQGTGMSYADIVSKFEKIAAQLPVSSSQLEKIQAQIDSASGELSGKKQQMEVVQLKLGQLQKDEIAKEKELEQKLDAKRKKLAVKEKEVEKVANLKAELGEQGLDIATLIKLAKEFGYGKG